MTADSAPSHFDLFELPVSFDVDVGRLDTRYRELQRSLHPDRFVNAGDRERLQSVQQATQVNEAYRTLKDPLLRGRYLLQLGGYVFDDEHHTNNDVEFLMEQMELRESLAAVRGSGDAFATLGAIMERITIDLDGLESRLATQLAAGNDADGAADTLVKMQFFRKLQDEAVELEVELENEMA